MKRAGDELEKVPRSVIDSPERGACVEAAHCCLPVRSCPHKLPHTARECDSAYTPTGCPYPGAYCNCAPVPTKETAHA